MRFHCKISKFLILIPLFGILFSGCGKSGKMDNDFEKLSENFVEAYFRTNPVSATLSGEHRFDSQLDDLSAEGIKLKITV